jgi:hypothetical protein
MEGTQIIAAIVDDLKPFEGKWRGRESAIRIDVAKQADLLRGVATDFLHRNAKVTTRLNAIDINKTIAKLRRQLRQASPELQMRLIPTHRPKLFHELAEIERECERAIKTSKDERGRKNEIKQWCAVTAHKLIVKYSKNDPTSGSKNSPFRCVAGSLYSYCAQFNKINIPDLERACEAVLKSFREAGIQSKKEKKPISTNRTA